MQPEPVIPVPIEIPYPPDLPVSARREEILAAVRTHQVVIVAGETGSGKTTQLPKMCLEAGLAERGRIGCTQPRRVAAMSVSRRVAEELAPLGYTWGREVGCKMRFNDDTSRETRIKFMTDGILLAEIQSDPLLRAYSTLILDEAHERSLNIDFLLGYLQGLLKRRADLKVIITSATIDTEAFSEAFGGIESAPIIEVSGRLFPVEIRYAPIASDEEGIGHVEAAARAAEEALIESDSGDVLVFMPTERDIRETRELLESNLGPSIDVLGLFGRMPAAEQQRIFSPEGRRRVIVATNVAETSLTIPRIGTVIDTGLARISRYNPRTRTKRLPVEAISQSSANQRAGRAGRISDGLCIRLYDEDDFEKRPRFTQPEIQRANLAEVILRMKAFRLGEVETFPFLNPPLPQAIRAGYQLLEELGALTQSTPGTGYDLTPLGRELARLPVDPTLGRMLLQAREEGALPEMLVIAAGLSVPDPRERPEDAKEAANAAHKLFAHPESDFLTLLNLWKAAPALEGGAVRTSRNALRRFCKTNFLSLTRMREWRDVYRQLEETMRGTGKRRPEAGKNCGKKEEEVYAAVHRSILAGLLGQIAQREERNAYKASGSRAVTLFPGSHLYERPAKRPKPTEAAGNQAAKDPKPKQPAWIVAGEIVQTSQLFARTVARIDPQWVVDLGSHLCRFRHTHPQWSLRAGRVLVWERALIHGLEVFKRQIDFGRVAPAEATELFIRGALVGDGETPLPRIQHRFFTENARLRERVATALTKVRSSRVHDLDETFYRFYAARIERASSIHDLDKLVRARIGKEPDFLCATEADILEEGAALGHEAFPDQAPLGNTVIPLTYTYNPGEETDGVTLRVPLPLAGSLTTGRLHWMIPGLRQEQAGALLRTLPKVHRKALAPLEPKIVEIARDFDPGDRDLFVALSQFVESRYRVAVPPGDWPTLPDYLRPRVEVIDRRNKTVATGRDLEALRARAENLGTESGAWDRAARRWEKTGLASWTFGNLPESIPVEEIGGAPLLAYPGLVLRPGGEVDLKLFRKREEADSASVAGVRRLAERLLESDLARFTREFDDARRLPASPAGKPASTNKGITSLGDLLGDLGHKIQAPNARAQANAARPSMPAFKTAPAKTTPPKPVSPLSKLTEGARRCAAEQLLTLAPPSPLTERRFHDLCENARREFSSLARKIGPLAAQILGLRETVLAAPKRHASLEEDLARLVPEDFLASTPFTQLPNLPRYLRAVQLRAERAWINPAKDAEKAKQLAPFANWRTDLQSLSHEKREAFRWLLEEFRVSLFAQELGTAQPVSAQRLERFVKESS